MKIINCKPYTVYTPKEYNPDCYAYKGSHYAPFAQYEVSTQKWKMELGDYINQLKEHIDAYLGHKLYNAWEYCYRNNHPKLAKAINKIRDVINPIPF